MAYGVSFLHFSTFLKPRDSLFRAPPDRSEGGGHRLLRQADSQTVKRSGRSGQGETDFVSISFG